MSQKPDYDWNESKLIDDVEFNTDDAKQFHDLLNKREGDSDKGSTALMEAGQLLTGRIVELTPDFVVVDVGLKSEGLIPLAEFMKPKELELDTDIEVLLDRTEGEDGQGNPMTLLQNWDGTGELMAKGPEWICR